MLFVAAPCRACFLMICSVRCLIFVFGLSYSAINSLWKREHVYFDFLWYLTLTSGLRLDNLSLAWPAVVQLLVFIYSVIQ